MVGMPSYTGVWTRIGTRSALRELVGLSDGGDVALELGDLVVETLLGLLLDPLAALGGSPILGIEGGDPGEGGLGGGKGGSRGDEGNKNGGGLHGYRILN